MSDPRANTSGDDPEYASDPPDQGTVDSPPAVAHPPASAARSMGVVLGLFALLVAFAAAGGVVFTWWQVTEQRELEASREAAAAEMLADVRELVSSTEARVMAQEERLGALNRDAEERRRRLEDMDAELRQARTRLESLAQGEAGPERTPALADIEFLLLLARRELTLGDNPKVALTALREADLRAARMEEAGMSDVRAAINDEIVAIEGVNAVDLEGLALRLASLARRVDGLPLRASLVHGDRDAPDPAAVEGSGWDRLVGRIQAAASSLFRVRRTETRAEPLLAPEESFFLYRNVELDLKSARLAVLARDRENYLASLAAARQALDEYFDTRDEAVRSLIASIETLEGTDIAPRWPDISRSLALLRNIGANR